jgi:hypothetical protein
MTLRERILARLALAEAATPGPWTTYGHAEREKGCMCFGCYDPPWGWEITEIDGPADPADERGDLQPVMRLAYADAAFIADRSPDRVIAECRADLALLEWATSVVSDYGSVVVHPEGSYEALTCLEARYPEGES